MPDIIDNFLAQLATLLGPLAPTAKAVLTAALPVAYAIVRSVADGKVDTTSLAVALSGLLLSVVVFLVPNKPAAK